MIIKASVKSERKDGNLVGIWL